MKNSSKASLILNCIFWAGILLIISVALFFSKQTHTVKDYVISFGVFGLLNIGIFYINYIILIPELIKKRKQYWWYVVCFILLIVVSSAMKKCVADLNP
ncbi:hypothetical protein [Pedobacter sp.]